MRKRNGTERMRNGTDGVKMRNGTDGVKMRNGTDMGLKCGTERIIRYSHKKYEYKQVWSLLQYRELGNIEKYTKAHQNMKNN